MFYIYKVICINSGSTVVTSHPPDLYLLSQEQLDQEFSSQCEAMACHGYVHVGDHSKLNDQYLVSMKNIS